MGARCACAAVLLTGSVHSGTAASAASSSCVLSNSSTTGQLLHCIRKRRASGKLEEYNDAWVANAEREAVQHMDANAENAVVLEKLNLKTPASEHFKRQAADWVQSASISPRVYMLPGSWDRSCEYCSEQLGYRYSLEHWMHQNLLANEVLLVSDPLVADFVYLPHCATGIFMHLVAKFELQHMADAKQQQKQQQKQQKQQKQQQQQRRNRHGRNSSQGNAGPVPREEILRYEGNLPVRAVRGTDHAYLLHKVQTLWSKQWEFQHCLKRPSCRFLVVSIYGRHVWRRFASFFGDKAVVLTHSGMSRWLQQQGPSFFLSSSSGSTSSSTTKTVEKGACRAVCEEHCVLEPPSVLPDDIVLPWTVAYRWTARSYNFASRDVLLFYSGTANSCSRELLAGLFREGFGDRLKELASIKGSTLALDERILIFPPEFQLTQNEWSELAFRSRLCLVPDGDSPNTGRLIEVIMHGCVPLIISNRLQPPLHEFIDWPSIAFFLGEEEMPNLRGVLSALARPTGLRRIAERHSNLAGAAHLLHFDGGGIKTLFFALRDRVKKLRTMPG